MKLKLLPLILLGIYWVNTAESYQNLPESACKIASEVIKKEPWMKTLAIVNFEKNYDEKSIDNLAECLQLEITVVMIDAIDYNLMMTTNYHADFVVLFVDDFNAESKVVRKLKTFLILISN
jgi:hypothetical protein